MERLGEDPEKPGKPFMTKQNLSQLENGHIAYTQRGLERIAEALNCTTADLLVRDPTQDDAPWDIYETVRALPAEKQADIAAMVKAIPEDKKTGTDD